MQTKCTWWMKRSQYSCIFVQSNKKGSTWKQTLLRSTKASWYKHKTPLPLSANRFNLLALKSPWATEVGRGSSLRTSELLDLQSLVLNAKYLSGSTFCNFHGLGVHEQAMGWITIGFTIGNMTSDDICALEYHSVYIMHMQLVSATTKLLRKQIRTIYQPKLYNVKIIQSTHIWIMVDLLLVYDEAPSW